MFNETDYVFLGAGYLENAVQHPELVPIRAAYSRNMDRVFYLFDIYEENASGSDEVQRLASIFATIIILANTSLEVLIGDLFLAFRPSKISRNAMRKRFGEYYQKEAHVFAELQNQLTDPANVEQHRKALKYLSLYRNALCHKGGLVDERFRRQIRELNGGRNTVHENLQTGEALPLDLSTVTSLCDSLQQLAHAYLLAAQAIKSANFKLVRATPE